MSSKVDIMCPDFELHPLLSTARHSELVLGPGEMLFIPRHCWHFVQAIDRQTAEGWRRTHPRSDVLSEEAAKNSPAANEGSAVEFDRQTSPLQKEEECEFSLSVSFWWGKRIEKKNSS